MNAINTWNDTKTIRSSTNKNYTHDKYSAKEVSSNNQIIEKDLNCNDIESNISHCFEKLQINTLWSKAARRNKRKKNQLIPLIEKLSIHPGCSKQNDMKKCAGEITSILNTLGVVIIQPQLTIILNISTPLYLCNPDSQDLDNINYIFLGSIDDVFGHILEPRYSVYYSRESTSFLRIGASVYYNSNDPKSQLCCVENVISQRFDVLPQNELYKNSKRSKRRVKKRCSMQPYHKE
ncbi:uncharacterized protein LOC107271900 isoform X2 [Cephus cinctus]|uniref:Uncharacterized protein LOC107271900 isoform X2 n=1 Tax=Cephus cinctus TaxID=211228 RepID=A0AAJ7C7L8_CEPCN|nr:uncharacterized protein LOC107271900 isoform X2 [Cephus cinctus]